MTSRMQRAGAEGREPPGTGTHARSAAPDGSLAIQDLLAAIWRHKGWVAVPLILVLTLSYVALTRVDPVYTSEANILVEDTQSVFSRPSGERIETQSQPDRQTVESHVQLLMARDLALSVVRELELTKRPEFDPLHKGLSLVTRLFVIAGIKRDPRLLTPEERALKVYYDNLSVYKLGESRVIAVVFSSNDPELAAKIANTVADSYIALQVDARRASTVQAAEWLGVQVSELRKQVEEAEAKVEDFKNDKGLVRGSNDAPLIAQQLSELNSQLILAKTQRAEAQARAQTIRELLRSGRDLSGAAEVVNSQHIQRLLEQQVTISRRIAELTPTLLPQHPRMRELNAELAGLKTQIRQQALKLADGLENEAQVAGARENAIRASLNELKQDAERLSEHEVELRALEREARAQRELLEALLSRFREATARDTGSASPAAARIISRATVSHDPSFPAVGPTLALIAMATLLLTVGSIVSLEILSFMRSIPPQPAAGSQVVVVPQPVQAASGAPFVATDGGQLQPRQRFRELLDGARSFNPAVREMAEQILARKVAEGCARVLVTSPQRQTRENAAALNMGRLMAALGGKTILIDANMRTPRLAEQMDMAATPGLADMLSGEASFADVIRRDPKSGLHIIVAGNPVQDPMPLLTGERIERVFDALEGGYSIILVDAPPVMLSPETRELSRHADTAVLVGDTLPGAQRLIEKARDVILAQNEFPVDVLVADPEISDPAPVGDGARDVA